MSKKSFRSSQSQSKEPGKLLHADLCGAMESLSIGKSRHFVLFKDDFSHYKFVFFLSQKSEVKTKFEGLLKSLDTQLGRKIKILRTDNGTEFVNEEMRKIMHKYGIKRETSVAYTPEQNRTIEREHRAIVEAARSMLYAKSMDIELWAKAVHTATYVINRTGTSKVGGKRHSTYGSENQLRKLTTESSIQKCGHIPKQKSRKWSAKAKKGNFVGYDDCSKEIQVWFPSEGKVEIHRDVKFSSERAPKAKEKQEEEYARIRTPDCTSDEEEPSDEEEEPKEDDNKEESSDREEELEEDGDEVRREYVEAEAELQPVEVQRQFESRGL